MPKAPSPSEAAQQQLAVHAVVRVFIQGEGKGDGKRQVDVIATGSESVEALGCTR